MLWVRNYDDLLEGWQRQPSLSLSCIKKTKRNNNKKFNDFLSQDMVHMDQRTCSLLFITKN